MHTKTTRPSDPAPSMTTSMKAIAAIVLMLMPTGVLAQSRTFYGADGRVTGRSSTNSSGATTIYDANGRVTGRTSSGSSGTTTIYDAGGRSVGTVTTQQKGEQRR